MIKLIIVFLIVSGIVFGLIEVIARMSGAERMTTVKRMAYVAAVAAITTVILAIVVAVF